MHVCEEKLGTQLQLLIKLALGGEHAILCTRVCCDVFDALQCSQGWVRSLFTCMLPQTA